MKKYKFSCGCEWPVINDNVPEGTMPKIDIDPNNIPDCPATWDLISRGETKGVFQLEKSLGKQWSKKMRPSELAHLSALAAILRPGCLNSKSEEGESMTSVFCKRKNGELPTGEIHEALKPILAPTYNVMVYQEQAMRIATTVAGFDLIAADTLRKAASKKKSDLMAEVKKAFLEGAEKEGVVDAELAQALWNWIEKSQKYSFNLSHSYCYGLTGYETAYLKTHIPLAFFTSWLEFAKDKPDPKEEVAELINDAKRYGISVGPPDFRFSREHFFTDGMTIKFGIADIKGVGEKEVAKFAKVIEEFKNVFGPDLDKWTWEQILIHVFPRLTSTTCTTLIKVGGLDWLGLSRSRMLDDYDIFQELSCSKNKHGELIGERVWVQQESRCGLDAGRSPSFLELMESAAKTKKEGGACHNVKRAEKLQGCVEILKKPLTSQYDSLLWMATTEEELLGIALSCSLADTCDMSEVNTTVKEFADGRDGFMVLGVIVRSLRVIKTKRGKNPGQKMAFMSVEDSSGVYEECVCFPDVFKQFGDILQDGEVAILRVERGKDDSMVIQHVWEAEKITA